MERGEKVYIRRIEPEDFDQVSKFHYTLSITEPLTEISRIRERFEESGFWTENSGAVAIVENTSNRLVGTCQFYQAGPCIHGFELGYVIHHEEDRRKGYASEALRLFSTLLFQDFPKLHRQQLHIEVSNTASWKLAERCDFMREGILRSSGWEKGEPSDCFVYSRILKDSNKAS